MKWARHVTELRTTIASSGLPYGTWRVVALLKWQSPFLPHRLKHPLCAYKKVEKVTPPPPCACNAIAAVLFGLD
jgi:hypothetical protein